MVLLFNLTYKFNRYIYGIVVYLTYKMNTTFNKTSKGQTIPDMNYTLGHNCIGQLVRFV